MNFTSKINSNKEQRINDEKPSMLQSFFLSADFVHYLPLIPCQVKRKSNFGIIAYLSTYLHRVNSLLCQNKLF